jgi:serine/threonine protein kinase HipA of HipAB toxin-antitoxin module
MSNDSPEPMSKELDDLLLPLLNTNDNDERMSLMPDHLTADERDQMLLSIAQLRDLHMLLQNVIGMEPHEIDLRLDQLSARMREIGLDVGTAP